MLELDMFLFRLGTHDLNEEIDKHRGGLSVLCVEKNVSVVQVLWECSAYKQNREGFMGY